MIENVAFADLYVYHNTKALVVNIQWPLTSQPEGEPHEIADISNLPNVHARPALIPFRGVAGRHVFTTHGPGLFVSAEKQIRYRVYTPDSIYAWPASGVPILPGWLDSLHYLSSAA